MLKGHGDDIYGYKREIVSNFSSNVYSRQDLSELHSHLCSYIDLIHSYPEPDAGSLIRLISEKQAIPDDTICVTNGATEAIYLIAHTFRESRSAIVIPTFSEYEDACVIHNHTLSFYQNIEQIPCETQLVWICNPNNPDGKVYDINFLRDVVNRNKDTLFIFDQSYGYFTDKEVWDIKEAVNYKNVILLHSMTKQYAVPGLRLGYLTAHPDIISGIGRNRMPWSVNGLAVEAGKFLIQNSTNPLNVSDYLKATKNLQDKLKQLKDLTVYPTDTHFFLCRLKDKTASELKSFLIEHYGILIRDASNFRGLDKQYFRIAAQSPEENNLLVKAIREWI